MVNSDFLPLEVRTKKCVIFLLFFSLAHEKKFLFKDHSVFVNQKKTLPLEFYSSQKDAYNIYSLCSCSNAVYPWIKPHFFLFFLFFCFLGHVSCQNYSKFPAPKLIGYLTSLSEWYKEEISLTDDPLAANLVIFFLSF